jgi:hypothetical protein
MEVTQSARFPEQRRCVTVVVMTMGDGSMVTAVTRTGGDDEG